MRFTFSKPPYDDVMHENALHIFSAKVTSTKVDFPFHVFGPTRAAMLETSTPVIIEVDLMLKGATDSEDQKLSSLAVPVISDDTMYSPVWKSGYTSKLSTIEFTLGHIIRSVEATIFAQVTRGSWPDGFRGQFSVIASGVHAIHDACTIYHTSVNDKELVVVSVDTTGELKVYVKAWGGDGCFMSKWVNFKPLDAGKCEATIDIGFCAMNVTIFWSLISYRPVLANSALQMAILKWHVASSYYSEFRRR
ncbi:hypothetical protein HU200_052150 [Digitaria exilis]|uniref:DUF6598 domain-containing protein n=1 Tax=Digitaria exilis TaxID=1010633 RepID=A0A835APQ5_9POAL|nr:hypothetical protein HU200_052150 [Digitaria exilis]